MTTPSPTELTSLAFFLADHAAVEGGKLYVNGGFWNRLGFVSFPATASFSVVAVVAVPWHDTANHGFTIRFQDPDGADVGGMLTGEFAAGTSPDTRAGEPTVVPLGATVPGLTVQAPGEYTAVLEIDGERKNAWPFHVVLRGERAAPAGSSDDPAGIPPLA